MTLVRDWMWLAVRYRWFVAFGVAWFAIVLRVVPIVSDLGEVGANAPTQVRGTLGAVSVSQTPAANALTGTVAGFDLGAPGTLFDTGADSGFTFDDDGGGGGGTPPPPPPEEPPAGCAADEQLPAPVATTVVGALAQGQTGVEDATGQPAPADAAGTVGGPAGCPTAPASGSSQVVGGLRPIELLFLLWGLPLPLGEG